MTFIFPGTQQLLGSVRGDGKYYTVKSIRKSSNTVSTDMMLPDIGGESGESRIGHLGQVFTCPDGAGTCLNFQIFACSSTQQG